MFFSHCKVLARIYKKALQIPIRSRLYSTTPGILNSGLPDIDIPTVSLDEYVLENIGKWENHTATVSFHFILVFTSKHLVPVDYSLHLLGINRNYF